MSEFTRGPTLDTASGDIVAISVPPDGPYGVNFTADADGNAAVIHSFDRLPNGKFGPLQKHGGLHYGDILFEINDVPLVNLNFNETIRMVSDKNMLKKNFKFMNSKLYYRKKKSSATSAKPTDGKNNFLSVVKRTRLAQIDGRKVTEFEVACQFTVVSLKVHKEIVYQWSVWKRFSDFSDLHTTIKRALGWQMDHIEFPSSHTFVLNKFSPDFVETRRDDLKEYWSKVLAIDKITDFTKHHCSQELKTFLEVDENTQQGVAVTADTIAEDQAAAGAMDDSKSSTNGGDRRSARMQRGMSMRRKSTNMSAGNKQNAFNFDDETPVSTAAIGAASSATVSSSQKPSSPKEKASEAPAAKAAIVPEVKPTAKPVAAPVQAPVQAPVAAPAAAAAPPPPPLEVPKEVAKPTAARANLLGSIAALRKD